MTTNINFVSGTTINSPVEKQTVTLVFTSTAGSTLTLMGYGANWVEVARAVV